MTKQRSAPEDRLTLVAAGIATAVSAQGMWAFFTETLRLPLWLTAGMFAFIEVAMITSAVRARRNMRENYSAGVDAAAVWVLTCFSATFATLDVLFHLDTKSLAEAPFRLAAPLVAAWLWDRGMAIERRRITGRGRINWRLTPERIFVRLGLAEPSERTAGEVDALRRLTRVALAADDMSDAKPDSWKAARRLARLKRRGRAMLTHTTVTTDRDLQAFLMTQLGVARGIAGLPAAAPAPFWAAAELPLPVLAIDEEPTAERAFEKHNAPTITSTAQDQRADDHEHSRESREDLLDDSGDDLDPDRDRPDERDNRLAEKWIRDRIRLGRLPSYGEVADKYSFSRTWARSRVQAARGQLEPQGYRFLPGNVVQPPPAEPVTGPVNGSPVALAGGAE